MSVRWHSVLSKCGGMWLLRLASSSPPPPRKRAQECKNKFMALSACSCLLFALLCSSGSRRPCSTLLFFFRGTNLTSFLQLFHVCVGECGHVFGVWETSFSRYPPTDIDAHDPGRDIPGGFCNNCYSHAVPCCKELVLPFACQIIAVLSVDDRCT